MRQVVVFVLALSLSGSPAVAQTLTLRDSAREAGVKLATSQATQAAQKGGIPPGYLWSSIGLIGLGGLLVAAGSRNLDPSGVMLGDCDTLDRFGNKLNDCKRNYGVLGLGVGLAGTGVWVLLLGKKKARAVSPQIVTTQGGVVLRSRLTF